MHGEGDQLQDLPYVPNVTDISDIENLAKQQEESEFCDHFYFTHSLQISSRFNHPLTAITH